MVLASTSLARRALLERLGLPFDVVAPGVHEEPVDGEPTPALVRRLAQEKARAGARQRPDALIIGSDQLAMRGEAVLGKPMEHAVAAAQLRASSERELKFFTAACVLDAVTGDSETHVNETIVRLRRLTDDEIESYLARERPYDCAGSFKSEGLGIALFEWIRGDDPTALQGLPLIWLCGALARAGVPVI